MPPEIKNKSKAPFFILMILVAVFLLEIFSYAALFAIQHTRGVTYIPTFKKRLTAKNQRHIRRFIDINPDSKKYFGFDSLLGWSIRPSQSVSGYGSNRWGFRGNTDFNLNPSSDKIRIAGFGDSFTHGDNVKNEETWLAQLPRLRPETETLNFGVSGYGLDQAFLRYKRDGKRFKPRIVFIGLMPENIHRHVSVFRPYYISGTGMPFAKPRFMLSGDSLVLCSNPLNTIGAYKKLLENPESVLPQLGKNDFHYHHKYGYSPFDFLRSLRLMKMGSQLLRNRYNPIDMYGKYNVQSEGYKITERLIGMFYGEVLNDGPLPCVVILPSPFDIARLNQGESTRYQPLLDYLAKNRYRHINCLLAFENRGENPMAEIFHGHYTPLANRLVAKYITDVLPGLFPELFEE